MDIGGIKPTTAARVAAPVTKKAATAYKTGEVDLDYSVDSFGNVWAV